MGGKMRKKVLITGIGIMTSLGIGIDDHIEALRNGRCEIGIEQQEVGNNYPKIVGLVPKFKPEDYIKNRKSIRMMNRRTILGCSTSKLAVIDSKLTKNQLENDEKNAVIFGSGVSDGITSFKDAVIPCVNDEGKIDYDKLGAESYRMLPPLWILPKLPNTTSGQITIENSIRGLSYSIVNESYSGFSAIIESFMAIESGRIPMVLCGGAEGKIYTDFYWLMKNRNVASNTKDGSKPFDVNSDGAIFSEGSSTLILEEEKKAKSRGAKIYGNILACISMYIPKYKEHDIEELSKYYEKSMRKALKEASLNIENIDFIQASASGILKNDYAEALAIKNIFGKGSYITTAHSSVGHTLAASGPISVSFALIQLENNFIAPIVRGENLFLQDELNYVKNHSVENKNHVCLVNSFDYCGNAGTVILSKVECL
jgi:3-oxoacyl-[acyl-carrier-protein] synthase II